MKKLIALLLILVLALSLASCGARQGPAPSPSGKVENTASPTDDGASGNTTDTEPAPDNKDDNTAAAAPSPDVSEYDPVEMEEVVYDANGVKLTLRGYRRVAKEEPDEYDSAVKVKLRIEKTAEDAQFGFLKTAVNGWLTSNSPYPTLRAEDIDPAGTERELSIRNDFLDRSGITEISEMGVLFAIKTGDHFTMDFVSFPLFSAGQGTAVSSQTKGFYNPGVLAEVSNTGENSVEAFYLVKCRDAEGRQLQQTDWTSGEMVDASIKSVMVKAGADGMPAAIKVADGSEWEYDGELYLDHEIADATAEFIGAIAYPFEDVSDQITATETSRRGNNDRHVYGSVDCPDELGTLCVYGTLLRYQNGELKSVASYWTNNIDPAKEDNYLYFDCYDRDYSNESFETVINYAYEIEG